MIEAGTTVMVSRVDGNRIVVRAHASARSLPEKRTMTELIGGGSACSLLVIAGLAIVLYLVPLNLWIAAWASGAYVGLPPSSGCACGACRRPR
jgi:hypothetical protein